jgi:hypothetical protein
VSLDDGTNEYARNSFIALNLYQIQLRIHAAGTAPDKGWNDPVM